MPQFYTLLTDVGQAKLANAVALGTTIEITQLAVGDGGGDLPTPDSSATALVNEVRRAAINASQTDPDNPSWIVVEQVLPPDVGGWTIREIGIYDIDGDLIGIGNYPETYKPVLAEGSSRTQTVRFVLEVSDTAAVTLKVDPSVVLATREYVDDRTQIANQTEVNEGTDDTKIVTAKKLKNWAKQASESVMGMLRVATQAQTNAGTDDTTAVTPRKLLFGFDASLGASGYIALPFWLLGFTVQWGSFTASYDNTSVTYIGGISYPIVFPSECYIVLPLLTAGVGVGAGFTAAATSINSDSFDFRCTTTGGGYSNVTIRFLAIGR